ncbi:MlaD family protein [Paraburkholderia dilworthii]|uniref:MlaD family protein n=1 Tax=Paraburkholderia dilworthii TaxID=948106 RepID=UPI000486E56F|nr:MlaD family protein [Paraburkholderia dilworthii]
MSDGPPRRTQADVKRTSWPGWIWSVPIAALAVAGWIGIRALVQGGEKVTVTFDNAYGMKADDTSVTMRGLKIGSVSELTLSPDGRHIKAVLKIDRAEEQYLRSGTRFYLHGAKPDIGDPSSLKGLISGPQIVMEPGPGKPAREFDGTDRAPALAPEHRPTVHYVVYLSGPAGELKPGAQVELLGFPVGTVIKTTLHYDPRTGTLTTPAEIALDPSQLGFASGATGSSSDPKTLVDTMLERLVAEGLRAQLTQDPPLVGSRKVKLDFVQDAPRATLMTENGATVIPAASSAGVDGIISKTDQIMSKINGLPIHETGEDVRKTVSQLRRLASSPKIPDTISHIDGAATQADKTLQQVSPQIRALAAQLRETASEVENTARAANHTLGAGGGSQNDLPDTLRELTNTARSIRALADHLDQHPEELLHGRPGNAK